MRAAGRMYSVRCTLKAVRAKGGGNLCSAARRQQARPSARVLARAALPRSYAVRCMLRDECCVRQRTCVSSCFGLKSYFSGSSTFSSCAAMQRTQCRMQHAPCNTQQPACNRLPARRVAPAHGAAAVQCGCRAAAAEPFGGATFADSRLRPVSCCVVGCVLHVI